MRPLTLVAETHRLKLTLLGSGHTVHSNHQLILPTIAACLTTLIPVFLSILHVLCSIPSNDAQQRPTLTPQTYQCAQHHISDRQDMAADIRSG